MHTDFSFLLKDGNLGTWHDLEQPSRDSQTNNAGAYHGSAVHAQVTGDSRGGTKRAPTPP